MNTNIIKKFKIFTGNSNQSSSGSSATWGAITGTLSNQTDLTNYVNSTQWKLNGNNNGTLKYIGTNDAFDFPIYTNNVQRATFLSTGEFGIGIATPLVPFHVYSTISSGRGIKFETNVAASLITFKSSGTIVSIGASNSATPGLFVVVEDTLSVHHLIIRDGKALFNNSGLPYQYLDLQCSTSHVSFGPRLTQPFQIYNETANTFLMTISSSGNVLFSNGGAALDATARLQVIGIDSTSANYTLKVDSSTVPLLYVKNNGSISMPNLPTSNAGLISGDLYVDLAANILTNGDRVVGRKV